MPSFNKFDFYQRAYAINQASGTASISTSNIRMGDTASYYGLAKRVSDTYATYDVLSVDSNYQLFNNGQGGSPEYYTTKFRSTSPNDQRASYLANTFVGKPVPKVNENKQVTWDRTCYPSALGDIRDNLRFSNLRDGAWVEAGYDANSNRNAITIYRFDVSGNDPYYINKINVSVNSGFPVPTENCRVFTSPGLNTDNVGSAGGGGHPIIVFFAWNSGTNTTYCEVFRWDVNAGAFGTLTSLNQYDLTSINFGKYLEFPYSGKHDIFYLSRWLGSQTYTSNSNYLLIVAGGGTPGDVYQLDLTNGNLTFVKGDAANYSDVNDIILIASNLNATFATYLSNINSGPVDTESISGLNVFDIDYNWMLGTEYFFIGDDQQGLTPAVIRGYLIYFNGSGQFSSAYYAPGNYFSYGYYYCDTAIRVSRLFKRVVAVDFGRIVVGSGPGLGTQELLIVSCINDGGYGARSFYKSGIEKYFTTRTQNEDFVAMNHDFCEDWTGYFNQYGTYQTSGLNYGLPVGAGNQHILNVRYNMDVCASTKNFIGEYYYSTWSGSYSDHFNYIIYLGQASWDPAGGGDHTANAWFYIAVAGGNSAGDFLISVAGPGSPPVFPTGSGKLQALIFYA